MNSGGGLAKVSSSKIEEQQQTIIDVILKGLTKEKEAAQARYSTLERMPRCMPEECRKAWVDVGFAFTFGRPIAARFVFADRSLNLF